MGGSYYDREVEVSTGPTGYSAAAQQVLTQNSALHKSLDPKRFSTDKLVSTHKHPIVFALDVTGSMGDWPKIIYDKMPMFYGQIMMLGYLSDPSISFCAIGDATCDKAPLQVTEFGQGKEIDQLIAKMYLEGGGGGNDYESYELSAYFYAFHTELQNTELPFFFVTGDEHFGSTIYLKEIQNVMGATPQQFPATGKEVWQQLKKKFEVFHVHRTGRTEVYNKWCDAIGKERVLQVTTPKAVIDVILGAIAIASKTRTLQTYLEDMKKRGQTPDRIIEVNNALRLYSSTVNAAFQEIKPKYEQRLKSEVIGNFEMTKEILRKEDLIALQAYCPDKILDEYICPITGEILYDPVMSEDGNTFERIAIECWFEKHDTSPVTNLKLNSKNLIPNKTLKKLIKEFYEIHRPVIAKSNVSNPQEKICAPAKDDSKSRCQIF